MTERREKHVLVSPVTGKRLVFWSEIQRLDQGLGGTGPQSYLHMYDAEEGGKWVGEWDEEMGGHLNRWWGVDLDYRYDDYVKLEAALFRVLEVSYPYYFHPNTVRRMAATRWEASRP